MHSDIAYINLRGTHYFFISVLDGYSRAIVFWDLCLSMTTADVELVIQRALETLPKGMAKPRIISDNGPQYLSTGFRFTLRDRRGSIPGSGWDILNPTERSNGSIRPSNLNASELKP